MEKQNIIVAGPKITLAQFLKYAGLCENGGQAKLFCRENLVLLNGQICNIPGKQLQEGDEICFVEQKDTIAVLCWAK